jgi:type IV pilus assembly protein PilY1
MKRVRFLLVPTLLVVAAIGIVFWSGHTDVHAQSNADYTSTPPFIEQVAMPNILLIMDSTSSMQARENVGVNYSFIQFDATKRYAGLFTPERCYKYIAGTTTRFEPQPGPKSFDAICGPPDKWDGNFLNWVALRRADAIKWAATGGTCVSVGPNPPAKPRDADGNCIPTPTGGATAMPTITHMTQSDDQSTGAVPFAKYNDRVDNTLGTSDLTFTIKANGVLSVGGKTFNLRVALESQPHGVLHDFAGKARFGLMQFSGSYSTDIEVIVPVGGRQALDYTGTVIETFNTNLAAMADAVDEIFYKSTTPLEEALYEAVRYFAQLPSAYSSGYAYPWAFSPAVALSSTGKGSIGSAEITALTGSETCPSGYITNACGRDPYFFGSNHTPPWSGASGVATCCQSFIVVMSDGEANQSGSIPAGLQSIAAYNPYRGTACTGSNANKPPSPLSTCSTRLDLTPPQVLSQHQTSDNHLMDEIAYWAHTTDLRQATIPIITEAGHDLPGVQNITFYAYQTNADLSMGPDNLVHMAMAGGFQDANGNNLPDNGLSGASAAACNMTDLTTPCEWDKLNNDTGAVGRDGAPDTFFGMTSADQMAEKLTAALSSILVRTSSGSAVSVLASSTTGEGAIYQSYFYPRYVEGFTTAEWIGFTQSLFVDAFGNLREDTNQDGKLVYQDDYIAKTRYDSVAGEVKVDRYVDANGDGQADATTPANTVVLKDLLPIWEGGKRLALRDPATRKILTWTDANRDNLVDAGEQIEFTTANSATLDPYLRAGAAPFTADNIIRFIRGEQVSGLRERQVTVSGSPRVWKLGDTVRASPVIVGPPKEVYNVIYGDSSYVAYLQQYKNRRQVAYVGANDGMLHALNVGYYHQGDDPSTTSAIEHGWFTRTPSDNSSGLLLGDELWGFIPYQLLPHLQWLTQATYSHVYYVDLKPKVTDVRIFTPDADHPNGWGTILIGGLGLGGSCKDCTAATGAPPMTVTANFGSGMQTRTFYSAYFVLDITNPEVDPKLLWSFTEDNLGLTTSYPAVLRVNPAADGKTSDTNAKWFAVFGSGPTGYNGASLLEGRLYSVDLKTGPGANNVNVTSFLSGMSKSFMGDLVSLDFDLDYRTDVVYAGSVIDTGSTPKWNGMLYRLTTGNQGNAPFGGDTSPINWGKGNKTTVLLNDFACSTAGCTGPTKPGPMTAEPTMTLDDSGNIWVFVGTGRFYTVADKSNTEAQYFFGVKDPVLTGSCTQSTTTNCQRKDLVNVSSASVCIVCTGNQVTDSNNTGVTTFEGTGTTSLMGLVQSKDGWYTTLPTARERTIVAPTLFAGVVFFSTFAPATDVCAFSGDGFLYALFYRTGSAYTASVIGTSQSGSNTNVKRMVSLGSAGIVSQLAIHIGAQGSGGSGGTSSTGCVGRMTGLFQSSTGVLGQTCGAPALSFWSRMVAWRDL